MGGGGGGLANRDPRVTFTRLEEPTALSRLSNLSPPLRLQPDNLPNTRSIRLTRIVSAPWQYQQRPSSVHDITSRMHYEGILTLSVLL